MKKRRAMTAGWLSLAVLAGMPAVNVLAAEPSAVVQPQSDRLTRGEFFKMLNEAVDLPEAGSPHTYKDIAQNSELSGIVGKLQAAGILHGYRDGTVRPEREIRASEAVALISGALGIPNQPAPGTASPLPSSHWARHIAAWLTSAKVDFAWDNLDRTLTRQEAQGLIKQMLSTSDSAKKLLEESQKAQQAVKSFQMKGSISLGMALKEKAIADMPAEDREMFEKIDGKPMSMTFEGAFMVPDAMYMKTNINAHPLMPGTETGPMDIEQYIIGKDMYMKMPEGAPADPENPTGWVKMKDAFPMDMKAMMEQQMSGIPPQLEKKLFYRDLGNGQLAFQGRIDKLTDLASMMNGVQGMEDMTASLKEAENVIQSIYMQGVMTLDSNTKLPKDTKMQVVVALKDKDGGAEDIPFKQITLSQDIAYSDYNGDVKVELPEAAKKAKEMSAVSADTQAFEQPAKN